MYSIFVFCRYAVSRGGARPDSGFANVPAQIHPTVADSGRKDDMPQGHIVLVMGNCSFFNLDSLLQVGHG